MAIDLLHIKLLVKTKNINMKIFDRLIIFFSKHWFNPFFTLWFNFRFLPFGQAVHLPILVWGRPKIINMSRNFEISFDCDTIKRGLVKINRTGEYPSHTGGHTEFILSGKKIVFKGKAVIGCGTRILSYLNSTIIIGNHVIISQQNTIISCEKLVFGDYARIGSRVQIMDSSMHFVYHADERKVQKLSAPVVIGHNSWLANGVSIYKGTILPPYSTVAGGSMVNQDYSQESEGTCFVGSPAKPKIRNFYRIRKFSEEMKLYNYFSEHDTDTYYYDKEPSSEIYND